MKFFSILVSLEASFPLWVFNGVHFFPIGGHSCNGCNTDVILRNPKSLSEIQLQSQALSSCYNGGRRKVYADELIARWLVLFWYVVRMIWTPTSLACFKVILHNNSFLYFPKEIQSSAAKLKINIKSILRSVPYQKSTGAFSWLPTWL